MTRPLDPFLEGGDNYADTEGNLAHTRSLIPADKRYIQQIDIYDGQCQKVGLNKMHGLRHAYAQARYEVLTGWKLPKTDGLARKELAPEQQIKDTFARQEITRELGHERIEIVAVYLGR